MSNPGLISSVGHPGLWKYDFAFSKGTATMRNFTFLISLVSSKGDSKAIKQAVDATRGSSRKQFSAGFEITQITHGRKLN